MSATKFTVRTRTTILEALRVGASIRTAAALGRINEVTLHAWLRKGKDAPEGTAYREFFLDVQEAQASPRYRALGIVQSELPGNAGLAFKYLERQEPGYAPPTNAPPAQAPALVINLSFHDGAALAAGEVIEGEFVEQDESAIGGATDAAALPSA